MARNGPERHFERRTLLLRGSLASRGRAGRRLFAEATTACNNRCLSCPHGQREARELDAGRLSELLERGAHDVLVLRGGEPTLRRDLPALLRAALGRPLAEVRVETNGRMLAYRDLCEELAAALSGRGAKGRFAVRLCASTPEAHDALSRAPGSFGQSVRGMRNLASLGLDVDVRLVLSRASLPGAAGALSLLDGLGPSSRLVVALPEGAGGGQAPSLAGLRASGLGKALRDEPERALLDSATVPFCAWPDLVELQSCLAEPDGLGDVVVGADGAERSRLADEAARRWRPAACRGCAYEQVCAGLPRRVLGRVRPLVRDRLAEGRAVGAVAEEAAGERAGAIALFSGGLDSTMAAHAYARDHPGERVLPVLFVPSYLLYTERALPSAAELCRRHPNVAPMRRIDVPSALPRAAFLDGLRERFLGGSFSQACLRCRAVWCALAVALCRAVGARAAVWGAILDDGGGTREGAEAAAGPYRGFFASYGVPLATPVIGRTKDELYSEAVREGFPAALLEGWRPGRENERTQGYCMLEPLKVSPECARALEARGYRREPDASAFEYGARLLEAHGVAAGGLPRLAGRRRRPRPRGAAQGDSVK